MRVLKTNATPIKKSTVLDSARAFGAQQQGSSVLGEFAIWVADRTVQGEVGVDDARDLYEAYFRAAQRVSRVDTKDVTFRVQASKLRCIIKMAELLGERAVPLLQEVKDLHRTLYDRGKVKDTPYHAMVRVCREVSNRGMTRVGRAAVAKIMTK